MALAAVRRSGSQLLLRWAAPPLDAQASSSGTALSLQWSGGGRLLPLQAGAPYLLRLYSSGTGGGDKGDKEDGKKSIGLLRSLFEGRGRASGGRKQQQQEGGGDGAAAATATEEATAAATTAEGGAAASSAASPVSATAALVPSGPEKRFHKVFVVELGRKPLFPGVYTAASIKDPKLIKELIEAKRTGGQAYVGAFLVRPTEKGAKGSAKDAAAAAASGAGGPAPAADGKAAAAEAAGDSAAAAEGTEDATVTVTATPTGGAGAGADGKASAADHLYEVGTFAQVHTIFNPDGVLDAAAAAASGGASAAPPNINVLLLGHRRIRRTAVIGTEPLKVAVNHVKDDSGPRSSRDILKATGMEIVATMKELLHMNPLYGEQFKTMLATSSLDLQDTSRLVDAAASFTSGSEEALQRVLEEARVPERAQQVLVLLKKEVELVKLQADIREQVEGKIMKEQRRMLLMEQLRSIKKELGLEKDDKAALLARFAEKWEPKKAAAPADVQRVVQVRTGLDEPREYTCVIITGRLVFEEAFMVTAVSRRTDGRAVCRAPATQQASGTLDAVLRPFPQPSGGCARQLICNPHAPAHTLLSTDAPAHPP